MTLPLSKATLVALRRHGEKRLHLDRAFHDVPISCKELFALLTALDECREALEHIYSSCGCNVKCFHSNDMQVAARSTLAEVFGEET